MLGIVIGLNEAEGTGIVRDSNGDTYTFDDSSVGGETAPYIGMSVYFELTKESQILGRVDFVRRILPLFAWSVA